MNSAVVRYLSTLAVIAALSLTVLAAPPKTIHIQAKHRAVWKKTSKRGKIVLAPIQGTSDAVLHPKKKNQEPQAPELLQKLKDMSQYKVKEW